MTVYHPRASYSGMITLPTACDWDSRDGMGWLLVIGSPAIPTLDAGCSGCSRAYNAATNPMGHVAWRQLNQPVPVPSGKMITPTMIRQIRTLLYRLSLSAYGRLPGTSGYSAAGGAAEIEMTVGGMTNAVVTAYTTDGRRPKQFPIRPLMTGYFSGGTSQDTRLDFVVTDVSYTGQSDNGVLVTINHDLGNPSRLWWGMADPGTARIVLLDHALPSVETMFDHESLWVEKRTITLTPADLDGNGAAVLSDRNGLHQNFRIARPIQASECVFGAGTFRLRLKISGLWVDHTASIAADDWARLQISHQTNMETVQTRIFLRGLVPDTSGTLQQTTDLIAAYGATEIEIVYWAQCPPGLETARYITGPLCGNCVRDTMEKIGSVGSGAQFVGIAADGRHWFCEQGQSASGAKRFVPGQCSQHRSCSHFTWGDAEIPTNRVIEELKTGVWLVEENLAFPQTGTTYYWLGLNGIITLLGHYTNYPAQYFTRRTAVMHGILGYWLSGSIEQNDITIHKGGVYEIERNGLSVYPAGLWDRSHPGILVIENITGPGASIQPTQQATGLLENGESDAHGGVRDGLVRVSPGHTMDLIGTAQWNTAARSGSTELEGESHVTRPIPRGRSTRTYYPAFFPTGSATYVGPHGTVQVGSWTIGGVEYGLKVERDPLGIEELGYKMLQGSSGPSEWGTVQAVSIAGDQVTIDCEPGLYTVAYSHEGGDDEVTFQGSGNVVRFDDNNRVRSVYDAAGNQVTFGHFERARAGDLIEFNETDCPSLSGLRFWLRSATAGVGASTGESIPVGAVMGLGAYDHLQRCDRLVVVDENGDLAAAISGAELVAGTRFRIMTGSGYSWLGDCEFGLFERGTTPIAVPAASVRIERASARFYVTAAYIGTLTVTNRHCAYSEGQLVGRMAHGNLTREVVEQILAALECATMLYTDIGAGSGCAAYGREIYANTCSPNYDFVGDVAAAWTNFYDDVSGLGMPAPAAGAAYALNLGNTFYTLSVLGGVYESNGTEFGSRRGCTRAALAEFYDLYRVLGSEDYDYTLLFNSADPGPLPTGSGTPPDGSFPPTTYEDIAWCNVVDNAAGQTNQGDWTVHDRTGLVSSCQIGARISTAQTNPKSSPGSNIPSTRHKFAAILDILGVAPINPAVMKSLGSTDTILAAYCEIKVDGLSVRTTHVDFTGFTRYVGAPPNDQIDWTDGAGNNNYSGEHWYDDQTDDVVGFALLGFDGTNFKVFDVDAIDTGTIENGVWRWIDITNIMQKIKTLWTGEASTGYVYDFYIVPCTPDYLNSISDTEAGDQGLVRLLPAVTVSTTKNADGTVATMDYECEAKLVSFSGLSIRNLHVAYQLSSDVLTPLLPEREWVNLTPRT